MSRAPLGAVGLLRWWSCVVWAFFVHVVACSLLPLDSDARSWWWWVYTTRDSEVYTKKNCVSRLYIYNKIKMYQGSRRATSRAPQAAATAALVDRVVVRTRLCGGGRVFGALTRRRCRCRGMVI
jgi:hypothetical protein